MFNRRRNYKFFFKKRRSNFLHPPARRRSFSTRQFISLFLMIIPLIVVYYLLNANLFKISQINCSLNQKACRSDHLDVLNLTLNKNSLFIKPTKISQQILSSDPSLTKANIVLIFPNTLKATLISDSQSFTINLIQPTKETPFSAPNEVSGEMGTESGLTPTPHPILTNINSLANLTPYKTISITSQGQIIPDLNNTPTDSNIYLIQEESSISNEQLKKIYEYIEELRQSGITFIKSWVIEPNFIIHLTPNTYTIFNLKSSARTGIATLQQIRGQATINLDRAIMDLRFNKPVISTY